MSPAPSPAYGDVNWNKVWKARQRRHESSMHFCDPSHDWDRRENAERYRTGSKGEYDPRVKMTIAGLDLTEQSRVLDIGAGPGTLAIPLAPLVKEITAVEPGKGMVNLLQEEMVQEGITNITCVRKRWEDVDPGSDLAPPYDIVLSSLSLTMEDLKAALEKMDAVSSRYVYIYWFADPPFWEKMYIDLWPGLHNEEYHPGPKADCVFSLLYQIGIPANVEMLPLDKVYRFDTKDEMVTFFRKRFGAKTGAQRRVLERYLAPMIRSEGGQVVISGDSLLAKVWWKKR